MPKPVRKWIVKLRMGGQIFAGIMEKNGIMNPETIIWEERKNDLVNNNDNRSGICDLSY